MVGVWWKGRKKTTEKHMDTLEKYIYNIEYW
jgi:hypothetical protein